MQAMVDEVLDGLNLAGRQYAKTKTDCGECHSKFRKEGGVSSPR